MTDPDIRKKIIEAATYLFGVEGYAATSTRAIAKRADVNIASLNYYFKSKKGLLDEVSRSVIEEFRAKIKDIAQKDVLTTTEYALKIYSTLTEDPSRLLNHFKLFLDTSLQCDELEPTPVGLEQLSFFLNKELNPSVPEKDRAWACNIIFGYLMHMAVLSTTEMGKVSIEKYIGSYESTISGYISKLIETIVRDLNHTYQ